MQTSFCAKLLIWRAKYPSSPPSSPPEENLFNAIYPLRPMVGKFHRVATLLLVVSLVLCVTIWLAMRVIYPQPQTHIDDISGYEALMPGETTNPEGYAFQLIGRVSKREETSQDKIQISTYTNSAHFPQVIIIEAAGPQKQIVRFTLYSNTLQLQDLLWRWGRPDCKQRDVVERHWDFMWYEDQYTVSTFSTRLYPNAPMPMVRIVFN